MALYHAEAWRITLGFSTLPDTVAAEKLSKPIAKRSAQISKKRATRELTTVGTIINWNHPRNWDEVCRRHAARQRWNSLRRFAADQRRQRLLALVLEIGGLERGAQSRIAEALGVHRSVISKDLKRILPLAKICVECGQLQPRLWVEDE
jgi:hypothetical protein